MNFILNHYKKNFKKMIIIILGMTLGILAISIGLSFFQDALDFSKEMSSGDASVSETLIYNSINSNPNEIMNNLDSIVESLNTNYEVSIGSITYPIDRSLPLSDAPSIVPIAYNDNITWKPHLIYGRYMSTSESKSTEKITVIGYDIYKLLFNDRNFDSNMEINIFGDNYKIIGVIGRTKRYSPQNSEIDIPYKNYFSIYEEDININSIPIYIRGHINFDLNSTKYNNLSIIDKPVYVNDIKIPLKLVLFIGALILLATIINESNLFSLWLLSRKKEIAIKKSLGATNVMIFKETLLETLLLSFISISLSFIIQYFICIKLNNILDNYELRITFLNFIISVVIALLIALFSSLVPYKIVVSTDPCNELKK